MPINVMSNALASSIIDAVSPAVEIQDFDASSAPPSPSIITNDQNVTDNYNSSAPFPTSPKYNKDTNIDMDLLLHDVFKHTMNGNFISPIDKSTMKNCLDIGFGSGIWMMEAASVMPWCQFFGIDIEPRAPQSVYPRNCFFEKGDVSEGLPYSNQFFDYVHVRLIFNTLTLDQLNLLFKEISRVIKPNGYIEFLEQDSQPFENCGDKTLTVTKFLNTKKTDLSIEVLLEELLKNNGFSHFNNVKVNIPMGKWAGMVGELYMSAFKLLLSSSNNNDDEYDEKLFKMIQAECDKYKTSFAYHIGFAKKS